MNIYDLISRAQKLRKETQLDSVSPDRVGSLQEDTLKYINEFQLLASSPSLHKIYASVSAMQSDGAPKSDLTGKPLKPGQLVVIVPESQTDATAGDVYRYDGPSGNTSAWTFVAKIGAVPADAELSAISTNPPQNKVVTEKLTELSDKAYIFVSKYGSFRIKEIMILDQSFDISKIDQVRYYSAFANYVGFIFKQGDVSLDARIIGTADDIARGIIDLPNVKVVFEGDNTGSATSFESISISHPFETPILNDILLKRGAERYIVPTIGKSGNAIDATGKVVASSSNNISAPIYLAKGDSIRTTRDLGSVLTAVAKFSNNQYTPVVLGGGIKTYTYTADEDCFVALVLSSKPIVSICGNPVRVIEPILQFKSNRYIMGSGRVQFSSSSANGISNAVRVYKGDIVHLTITATIDLMSPLCYSDEHGENLKPIALANEQGVYSAVIEQTGYIVVGGNISSCKLSIERAENKEYYEQLHKDVIGNPVSPKYSDKDAYIPEKYGTIFCYKGDDKVSSNHIVNAVAYANGEIIACRVGKVVKIANDGTEVTLLTIAGATDWRGCYIDSNNNVYVSPHNSAGGSLAVADRGLYRLAYGATSFEKVIALYNPSSSIVTETQSNDDNIWTMCEDNFGRLYAGVYAHSKRANPSVYCSDDGGITWSYICNFIDKGYVAEGSQFGNPMHIHCIIFNEYDRALYCIVGEVETIFKSTDGGFNWEDLNVRVEDEKGTTLIAVPDGILIGSDGTRQGVISKLYADGKVKTIGKMWHAEFFGMRKSDVTGWLYAFTKIESTINSSAYPPYAANEDAAALEAWKTSANKASLQSWIDYNEWVSERYSHDSVHPTSAAILVSRDNGESWEIIYKQDTKTASGIGAGIFCVGYFRNGECLCGITEQVNGGLQFVNPIVVSEGKHRFGENGIDLSGEIFAKTNL